MQQRRLPSELQISTLGKPLKLFSPVPQAAFYTLAAYRPALSSTASQGALRAGQNKLILDEDILKLDQPVSGREGHQSGNGTSVKMRVWSEKVDEEYIKDWQLPLFTNTLEKSLNQE